MVFDGFKPIEKDNGLFKVEMAFYDEGWHGDYLDAPDDDPLLRFTVFEMLAGKWEEVHDGSYCTRLPATTDRALVEKAVDLILTRVTSEYNNPQGSVKTILQRLSWIEPAWVR